MTVENHEVHVVAERSIVDELVDLLAEYKGRLVTEELRDEIRQKVRRFLAAKIDSRAMLVDPIELNLDVETGPDPRLERVGLRATIRIRERPDLREAVQ